VLRHGLWKPHVGILVDERLKLLELILQAPAIFDVVQVVQVFRVVFSSHVDGDGVVVPSEQTREKPVLYIDVVEIGDEVGFWPLNEEPPQALGFVEVDSSRIVSQPPAAIVNLCAADSEPTHDATNQTNPDAKCATGLIAFGKHCRPKAQQKDERKRGCHNPPANHALQKRENELVLAVLVGARFG